MEETKQGRLSRVVSYFLSKEVAGHLYTMSTKNLKKYKCSSLFCLYLVCLDLEKEEKYILGTRAFILYAVEDKLNEILL